MNGFNGFSIAYQGKKKGAETAIDRLIYFKDEKRLPKKIVVSVKAGEGDQLWQQQCIFKKS